MTNLEFAAPKWAQSENYSLVLLNASKAGRLWRNEPSDCKLYVASWEGAPSPAWFSDDGVSGDFETSVASINELPKVVNGGKALEIFMSLSRLISGSHYLSFINGRHRTRWLMANGVSEIPICLDTKSAVWAVENAVARPVVRQQLDLQIVFRCARSA